MTPADANLLIVDDTPANLRLLTDMLKEQSWRSNTNTRKKNRPLSCRVSHCRKRSTRTALSDVIYIV